MMRRVDFRSSWKVTGLYRDSSSLGIGEPGSELADIIDARRYSVGAGSPASPTFTSIAIGKPWISSLSFVSWPGAGSS